MTSPIPTLYAIELRRMLTPLTIAIPFLLMVLTGAFLIAMIRSQPALEVPMYVMSILGGFLVPVSVLLLAVGMVASDVKDHWLRTLLMRPITRTDYVLARIGAVYTFILATIILAGIVPMVVVPGLFDKPLVWMVSRSLPALGFLCAHALMTLLLLTLLSCWLPGIANVIMLGLWFLGASAISAYVRWQWWDSGVAVIAMEFLFPSGFFEAAESSARHSGDPFGPALWGIAAAVMALTLTIWSLNRMRLDGGSE